MHVIVLQGLPLIGVDDLLVAVILGIALPFGVVWARQAIAVRRSGIRP